MSDEEMIQLVCMLSELDEFQRKQIAILLMSTTLNPLSVEEVAGFMVGIAEEKKMTNHNKYEKYTQCLHTKVTLTLKNYQAMVVASFYGQHLC